MKRGKFIKCLKNQYVDVIVVGKKVVFLPACELYSYSDGEHNRVDSPKLGDIVYFDAYDIHLTITKSEMQAYIKHLK